MASLYGHAITIGEQNWGRGMEYNRTQQLFKFLRTVFGEPGGDYRLRGSGGHTALLLKPRHIQ